MNKQELRSAIRARKRAMTMEEIETRSDALCQKFLESDAYRACRIAEKYGLIPYAQPAAFDDWFLPAGYGRELLSLTLFFLENL